MKLNQTVNVLTLSAALVVLAGCQKKESSANDQAPVSGADVKEKASNAFEATKQFIAQSKDQAVKAMQENLKDMDSKIDALSQKASTYSDQAKANAEAALAKLRSQRDAVAKKLDQLKGAGQDAWKNVESGINQAWQKLQKTYEDTKKEFKD